MINPRKFTRAFESHNVFRLCYNANYRVVATVIATNGTSLEVGKGLTLFAKMHLFARINKRLGKLFGSFGGLFQNMLGQAPCGFLANTGQPLKLGYKFV